MVTEEEMLEFYGKLSEVEEELKQGKMVFPESTSVFSCELSAYRRAGIRLFNYG